MPQPTPYNRVFSFTNDQTANPSTKTPGNQLDAEYNAVLTSISQILANLALIQRDDGQLANQTVGAAQLKPEITSGVQPAAIWTTSTAYGVNATVFSGLKLYRCLVAHISGTFATNLAAGDWVLLADFTTAITAVNSGVLSLGNQVGVLTLAGGDMSSTVLPVARYDAVQTLLAAQQLQLCNNSQSLYIGGSQTLDATHQLQAANNILAPSGAGAQSLSVGQKAQINTNVGALSIANNLSEITNTNTAQKSIGLPAIMRSYLAGLTLSTAGSSATFSVAAGVAADSTNADFLTLAASISKTTAAWTVGTGNGALDTGAIANSTWYHAYGIKRPDTGVVDVCVSLSATAPTTGGNIPAAYTSARRIGSMKTNGSGQWTKFYQDGDVFNWDTPPVDVSATNPGTSSVLRTLSVPLGVRVEARLTVAVLATAAADVAIGVYVRDPQTTDQVVNVTTALTVPCYVATAPGSTSLGGQVNVFCNTSSQVATRLQASGTNTTLYIHTPGWRDTRGRYN